MRVSPAASSFFIANSGEVCRYIRRTLAVIADGVGGEGMQMRLIPRADLQAGRVDLDKLLPRQPAAQGRLYPVAPQQRRAAIGMARGCPPGGIVHVCFHLEIRAGMG